MKLSTLMLLSGMLGLRSETHKIGDGRKRAEARLMRKATTNRETYADLPEVRPSRQVLRAEVRAAAKTHRSGVKQVAMREKWKGGAAVVR